jgi:phosphate transport system substrate-binding protein
MILGFLKCGARVTIISVFAASTAFALDIFGAGASFPYPLFARWVDTYKKETGNSVNYQSLGSGAGIKMIKDQSVTFGASDQPLKAEALDGAGLIQWPQIIGAIVLVVNLDGVASGDLTLSGEVVAKIFLREITSWDDAAIKKLNPKLKLAARPIIVIHRADTSGTTFNFTNYLSKVSADWKSKVGEASAVEWPIGVGAKGNEGVAEIVANTKGAIGYVEYAYAKQNKMAYTKLINKDGKEVSPSSATFQAAAARADWAHAPAFYQILTDQPGAQSWPITSATFVLLPKQPRDTAAAREVLRFFRWAFANGGKVAEDLEYVSMPPPVVMLIKNSWTANVKDSHGKPLVD